MKYGILCRLFITISFLALPTPLQNFLINYEMNSLNAESAKPTFFCRIGMECLSPSVSLKFTIVSTDSGGF